MSIWLRRTRRRSGLAVHLLLAASVGASILVGNAREGISRVGKDAAASQLSPAAAARLASLLPAVERFRAAAASDYDAALAQWALPAARSEWSVLDHAVWIVTPPRSGWSYFFDSSIYTYGMLGSTHPVVAFYSPMTDVFLLTAWQISDQQPHIESVELLVGDWLRRAGKPPFEIVPAWHRSPRFKPLAMGVVAAEALRRFEHSLPLTASGDWRQRIPVLTSAARERQNYATAAILFGSAFRNLVEYYQAEKAEEPRLAGVRARVEEVVSGAARGDLSPFAKAPENLPAMLTLLRATPREIFADLQVALAVAASERRSFVFLIAPHHPGLYLALTLEGTGARQQLCRGDMVSYADVYRLGPLPSPAAGRDP